MLITVKNLDYLTHEQKSVEVVGLICPHDSVCARHRFQNQNHGDDKNRLTPCDYRVSVERRKCITEYGRSIADQ